MRTLWLTCPMADTEVRVYVATADDSDLRTGPDDPPAEGMALRGDGIVLINADVPQRRRMGVLVHELLHQAIFLSGVGATVRLNDAREEALVSAIAPLVTHALAGAGVLKGRRVPR